MKEETNEEVEELKEQDLEIHQEIFSLKKQMNNHEKEIISKAVERI